MQNLINSRILNILGPDLGHLLVCNIQLVFSIAHPAWVFSYRS